MRKPIAMALLGWAASIGKDGISSLGSQCMGPPRDKCVQCGGNIPPGKPGRKCKVCRPAS